MAARFLVLILAIYGFLAYNYIDVTPWRASGHLLTRMQGETMQDIGAPDERQHMNYARSVASGNFPVFRPGSPDLYETYQSHQPPLYYVLAAPFVGEGKWLRLLNTVLGALVIVGIFTGIRRFTGNVSAALFAAGFTALLPMFIAISAAVTNDMLLYLIAVLVMNVIALGWERGWDFKNASLLGLILGLGLLTKTSALLFFPVALAGLLLRRCGWRAAGLCFIVALLAALPWLWRNQVLYGDPLALRAFQEASVGNLPASDAMARVGAFSYWFDFVGVSAVQSFWGVFGYFDVFMSDGVYATLNVFAFAAVIGLVWRLGRGGSLPDGERALHFFNLLLLVFVLLGFISYNLNYFQAQARYIYPAIFAIASGFSFGIWQLSRGRWFWPAAGFVLASLLAFNLYVVLWLLPAAFAAMQR